VMTEPWVDLEGHESLNSHNGSEPATAAAPLVALPTSGVEAERLSQFVATARQVGGLCTVAR
jgi:hypothetical protein